MPRTVVDWVFADHNLDDPRGTGWLVYRLTGSAVLLGTVSFAGQAPTFFLAPVAGVLVDRWDRQRTLVITQVMSLLQSFAMAGLALTGLITVGHIVALAIFQGVVNAFCDMVVVE